MDAKAAGADPGARVMPTNVHERLVAGEIGVAIGRIWRVCAAAQLCRLRTPVDRGNKRWSTDRAAAVLNAEGGRRRDANAHLSCRRCVPRRVDQKHNPFPQAPGLAGCSKFPPFPN